MFCISTALGFPLFFTEVIFERPDCIELLMLVHTLLKARQPGWTDKVVLTEIHSRNRWLEMKVNWSKKYNTCFKVQLEPNNLAWGILWNVKLVLVLTNINLFYKSLKPHLHKLLIQNLLIKICRLWRMLTLYFYFY